MMLSRNTKRNHCAALSWAVVLIVGCDTSNIGDQTYFGGDEGLNDAGTTASPDTSSEPGTVIPPSGGGGRRDTSQTRGSDVDRRTDMATDSATATDSASGADSEPQAITAETCVEHTANETDCRDCCDCREGACEEKKSCRDACADHEYKENSNFIELHIPMDHAANYDHTPCIVQGEERACKTCCDCSPTYLCGDLKLCRTACEEELY